MVDITVSKENHDFTEREQTILEVLMLNLTAHANSFTVKQGMAMNPLEKKENDLFHFQFAWEKSISEELFQEFVQAVEGRYNSAFKMCDMEEIQISFEENSYLNK